MLAEGPTAEFTTWSAAGHSIRIHYRNDLVNLISEAAWEGLQKVPRRGLEIGGVLYGERDGDDVRVLEWRPIACEHASGPSFELSERDKEKLRQQLLDTDAAPQGLMPVGWFHSRTKDGVFLSEADIALYQSFFPAAWQIALVVRPHLYDPPRAGFFFREPTGSVQAERSYGEFELPRRSRRLPVGFDPSNPQVRSPLREGSPDSISPSTPVVTPPPLPPRPEREPRQSPPPEFETSKTVPLEHPPRQGHWRVWLAVAIPLLVILIVFGAPLVDKSDASNVLLQTSDMGGLLLLEWNHSAAPVMAAESGLVRIVDGPNAQEVPLSGEELRNGSVTYQHRTGDVVFQLDLMMAGGEMQSEVTRFLGAAPPSPSPAEDSGQRAVLEAEAELIQRQLADEEAQNQELRATVERMRQNVSAR